MPVHGLHGHFHAARKGLNFVSADILIFAAPKPISSLGNPYNVFIAPLLLSAPQFAAAVTSAANLAWYQYQYVATNILVLGPLQGAVTLKSLT